MTLELTDLEYQLVEQALLTATIKGEHAKIMYPLLIKLEELKNGPSEES